MRRPEGTAAAAATGGGALRPDVVAACRAAGLELRPSEEVAAVVRGMSATAATAVRLPPPPSSDFSDGLQQCREFAAVQPRDEVVGLWEEGDVYQKKKKVQH